MKRYLLALMIVLIFAIPARAEDFKDFVAGLTANTSPAGTDIIPVVTPGSPNVTKKVTITNLITAVLSNQATYTAPATGSVICATGTNATGGCTYLADVAVPSCPTIASTSTATGVTIDGAAYCDYNYSNGASTAAYTPVVTSAPASGKVRYITMTFGGGVGVVTLTWTNVNWIGTAGSATTTTNKKSTYACKVDSSSKLNCAIVSEAY